MYHGTEIDWPMFDPERMEVRGKNINDLIGVVDPFQMFFFILNGTLPTEGERSECETALWQGFYSIKPGQAAWEAAAKARRAGASVPCALIAGLATGLPEISEAAASISARSTMPPDICEGWVLFGVLPAILYALADHHRPAWPVDKQLSALLLQDFTSGFKGDADITQKALNAVLVGMQAGYGYLAPTVMLPRVAAGTKAELILCLIAGFSASGPAHVGGSEECLELLSRIKKVSPQSPGKDELTTVLIAWSSEFGRIPGFGHPLFRRDPRVSRLREYLQEIQFANESLSHYDTLCAVMIEKYGLHPNIDSLNAAVLSDLGLQKGLSVGLFLCMRAAAMIAHVFEKRRLPRFGVTSATARGFLHKIPVGWI
jgi:citrate synthase